jgi:hypothetical protein
MLRTGNTDNTDSFSREKAQKAQVISQKEKVKTLCLGGKKLNKYELK